MSLKDEQRASLLKKINKELEKTKATFFTPQV